MKFLLFPVFIVVCLFVGTSCQKECTITPANEPNYYPVEWKDSVYFLYSPSFYFKLNETNRDTLRIIFWPKELTPNLRQIVVEVYGEFGSGKGSFKMQNPAYDMQVYLSEDGAYYSNCGTTDIRLIETETSGVFDGILASKVCNLTDTHNLNFSFDRIKL